MTDPRTPEEAGQEPGLVSRAADAAETVQDLSTAARRAAQASRAASTAATGATASSAAVSAATGAAGAAGAAAGAVGAAGAASAAAAATPGASIAKAAVGEVASVAASARKGDAVGVADSAVRAAGVGAATYFGGAAGATVATAVLDSKAGRATSRGLATLVIALILVPVLLLGGVVIVGAASFGALLPTMLMSSSANTCASGGVGVPSGVAEQQAAADIIARAYARGLGRDGAVLGVMTALTESNLRVAALDSLQPDSTPPAEVTVGVFQQMPRYWTRNDVWPTGTPASSPLYADMRYVERARTLLYDTSYAADRFYDRLSAVPGWQSQDPWAVAQTVQRSIFDDGSNYQRYHAVAELTVDMLTGSYPALASGTKVTVALPASGEDLSAAGACAFSFDAVPDAFHLKHNGPTAWGGGQVVWAGTDIAMARAASFVGNAGRACSDGMCESLCGHLAGKVWGRWASGHASAISQWRWMDANGYGVREDRNPPLGALLYWEGGQYGHVATYVGNGMVVSNWAGSPYNVYLMPADIWDRIYDYKGWSPPAFARGLLLDGVGIPEWDFTAQ